MKKNTLMLLVSALLNQFSFAQNLVPNPSFEDFNSCVNSLNQVYKATGWHSYRSSPDYFNACDTIDTLCSVPYNGFGFQYPHSGNAYCGFYSFGNPNGTPNYREIIGTHFTSSLSPGTKYYISFYLNMTIGSYFTTRMATNKIGALFTTFEYDSVLAPAPINNFAQVYTDSIITDSMNWVKVFSSFVADSAYEYIYLGNFFDDDHTDTIMYAPLNLGAYYFIDDVCLSTDSSFCNNWTSVPVVEDKNGISIFPNPSSGLVRINSNDELNVLVSVFDMLGRSVFFYEKEKGRLIEIPESGIYVIVVSDNSSTAIQKIIIDK